MIQNFNDFLNEKKYTDFDRKKDINRIADIVRKATEIADKKGTNPEDEMIKLAKTQANRITNMEKSHNRGLAAEEDNYDDIAKVFFDREKELEKVNESLDKFVNRTREMDYDDDEDEGLVLLTVDDKTTTWYYLDDAIINGLLEETLNLDNDICEDFAKYLENKDIIDYFDMESLKDLIVDDFEGTLDKLFDFLKGDDIFFEKPTVQIDGEDEYGEFHEYYYEPEIR